MMRYLFLLLPFLVLFTGCPSEGGDEEKMVFRYNQSSGITSLDPAFAKDQANMWVINQLFDGLVRYDNEMRLQPALAKSWEISEDGLTYTFNLRDDVYFHDNDLFTDRKLKASDAAYSLSRLIDPKVASPGSWLFAEKLVETEPFIALDDLTFQIKLTKPFKPLLSLLALQYCFIVPQEAVEHYGKDFRKQAVGTGPFSLRTWKEGNALIMVKNPRYFMKEGANKLPYLDGIKVSFVDSKQTEYLNFRNGKLDLVSGVDASFIDELLTKDGELQPGLETEIRLYKAPYLNTEYLGIMTQDEGPLADKRIRQAINYGFDRVEIVRFLRNNVGQPATSGFVPYGLPSFNPIKVPGYQYDVEKAKALLTEAGHSNGAGLGEITLYTNANYEDIGTYISKELAEIGLTVKLDVVPAPFQRELMAKGEAPFFRGSWIADYADAENYLALFYSGYGAPPNYTRFNNSKFDSLYLAAQNENTEADRYVLYQEMDRIILEEAAVVPLFYDEVLRFTNPKVSGLKPNAMNMLDLRWVKVN